MSPLLKRAEIKGWDCTDVEDELATWIPEDPADVYIAVTFHIGVLEEEAQR